MIECSGLIPYANVGGQIAGWPQDVESGTDPQRAKGGHLVPTLSSQSMDKCFIPSCVVLDKPVACVQPSRRDVQVSLAFCKNATGYLV